jgi:hypothetical protein
MGGKHTVVHCSIERVWRADRLSVLIRHVISEGMQREPAGLADLFDDPSSSGGLIAIH